MIPNINILTQEITDITYPNRTYRIVFDRSKLTAGRSALSLSYTINSDTMDESSGTDRISGFIDDIESVVQSVYLILNTERYMFVIYSWDYGVELIDLFGKPMPYVTSELPRRIKEALLQDDRIADVVNFEFEPNGKRLYTKFTVVSNLGNIDAELEVSV